MAYAFRLVWLWYVVGRFRVLMFGRGEDNIVLVWVWVREYIVGVSMVTKCWDKGWVG